MIEGKISEAYLLFIPFFRGEQCLLYASGTYTTTLEHTM
jgi:hypothetical protein